MSTNKINGVILGYRRGSNIQYNNQVYVKVFVDPEIVHTLVGSKVVAKDVYGNVYKGKVVKVHGRNNSIIIVWFNPNIPGQLIGSLVDIVKD